MRLFVLPALLFVATTATAAPSDAQRQEFLAALKAAQRGQIESVSAEVADLQDYPLRDYLTAADLRYRVSHNPGPATDQQVSRFVANNPDLPPAQRLRGPWLSSLAGRGDWQAVIDNTQADDSTAAQCRALNARIELGQSPVQDVLAIYGEGKSQPSECDAAFGWLDSRGYLTAQVVQERARKAVLNNQLGLARYLSRQVPGDGSTRIEQWLSVAETPSNMANAPANLDGDVAVYAFKRLALRDMEGAADLVDPLVARLQLDDTQRYEMRRYIALLYAEDHQPEALLWFARIDHARMADDDHALGWEIRSAIFQQRWPLVIDAIRQLPPKFAQEEEWRYWMARALEATGNTPQAQAMFAALAQERSYHGYLAADAIGQSYSLNERPVPRDPGAEARLEARPAMQRARELHALGMVYDANREWSSVINGLDKPALAQAARIAYEWQWYSRAVTTLAKADYWDDLDIRYPTPFTDQVENAAAANDLDPAYVMAIIRTESLFQPDARSPADARGLMQLLPGTASHVARDLGQSAPSAQQLFDPATNISLGSHYLRLMLDNWNDNIALATASYNAGPGKIARWLPAVETPADIWIANIPYTETRGYVQRVMSHMTVFQSRLHESIVPLDKRISDVRPTYSKDTTTTY